MQIVGIDEAGRGPLAGPVAVGVVALLPEFDLSLLAGIRDSKKLSERMRNVWFEKLEVWQAAGLLRAAVVYEEAGAIDELGIATVIRRAVAAGLSRVATDPHSADVRLDGSLCAPKEYVHQRTIIRGDESEPVISLASVAAKVSRDRRMRAYAETLPEYGFEIHKGYGTKKHYEALALLGPSVIHRRTFLKG